MNKLYRKFKKCKNDSERWQFIFDHKDGDYIIELDSDNTIVIFGEDQHVSFDGWLGYSDGVFTLLDTLGIKCDCV